MLFILSFLFNEAVSQLNIIIIHFRNSFFRRKFKLVSQSIKLNSTLHAWTIIVEMHCGTRTMHYCSCMSFFEGRAVKFSHRNTRKKTSENCMDKESVWRVKTNLFWDIQWRTNHSNETLPLLNTKELRRGEKQEDSFLSSEKLICIYKWTLLFICISVTNSTFFI